MRSSEALTLPRVESQYVRSNEEVNRKSIVQAYQNLRNDVIEVRNTSDRESSLALRRHQFLLMGA